MNFGFESSQAWNFDLQRALAADKSPSSPISLSASHANSRSRPPAPPIAQRISKLAVLKIVNCNFN
jgi:hypothetical protein